jgi:hypothetical protein
MSLGGYQPVTDLAAVQELVNTNAEQIGGILGVNGNLTVNSAEYQVVAGTNYRVNLTASNGTAYNVNISVGLDGNVAQITHVPE